LLEEYVCGDKSPIRWLAATSQPNICARDFFLSHNFLPIKAALQPSLIEKFSRDFCQITTVAMLARDWSKRLHSCRPVLKAATRHGSQALLDRSEYFRDYGVKQKDRLSDYNREYYLRNKDNRKHSMRDYLDRNEERIRDKVREYDGNRNELKRDYDRFHYTQNDTNIRKSQREYATRNQDNLNESGKDHYSRNKENMREIRSEYNSRNEDTRRAYYVGHRSSTGVYAARLSSKSWKTPELVRAYFDSIKGTLLIADYTDWYRVSRTQIAKHGGV
jgi:hypothetical protein